jgi:hypothetical protein
MKKLVVVAVVLMVAVFVPSAWAMNITFTWNPNSESDLAGYRLFQRESGTSYDYGAPIAEIPAGTEVCVVEDVSDGDYRWVLRAFDTAGNESTDSNECSLLVDNPPDAVVGFG